jgi:hypothetical protein
LLVEINISSIYSLEAVLFNPIFYLIYYPWSIVLSN